MIILNTFQMDFKVRFFIFINCLLFSISTSAQEPEPDTRNKQLTLKTNLGDVTLLHYCDDDKNYFTLSHIVKYIDEADEAKKKKIKKDRVVVLLKMNSSCVVVGYEIFRKGNLDSTNNYVERLMKEILLGFNRVDLEGILKCPNKECNDVTWPINFIFD